MKTKEQKINITNVNEFVTKAAEISAVTEYGNTALRHVSVPSHSSIKLGQSDYRLSTNGLATLLDHLKIPRRFGQRQEDDLLEKITKLISDKTNSRVGVKFVDGVIDAFYPIDKLPISDEHFANTIFELTNNKSVTERMKFGGVHYDPSKGEMYAYFKSNENFNLDVLNKDKFDAQEEVFGQTIMIRNSSSMEFASGVYQFLERIVCTNLSTIGGETAGLSKTFHHSNPNVSRDFKARVISLLGNNQNNDLNFIKTQTARMMNVNMSLKEMFEVVDAISRYSNHMFNSTSDKEVSKRVSIETEKERLIARLGMPVIEKKYGMPTEVLRQQSSKYLSTGSTPTSVYEGWNTLTDFFSNSPHLTGRQRQEGYVLAGSILAKSTFDYEEKFAPKIIWN